MNEVIARNNKLLEETFLKRDFKALANLYTEDCHLFQPGAPKTIGRQAAEAFWSAAASDAMHSISLETSCLFGPMKQADGIETLVEEGGAKIINKDGGITGMVKYVVIWKKVDDDWKLMTDIWNSDS